MDNYRLSTVFNDNRSSLVNLPSNISNLLFNANINIQDVIIEIVHEGKKSYCGWSGMTSIKMKTIEIDPVFASSLMVGEHKDVIVNLKLNNFETSNLELEPLTSSDWELVELHAQNLEEKLLSQVRCISKGQVLVVYPSQSTCAKLKVASIGTDEYSYAKISPSCEVAIAPKVRKRSSNSSSKSQKSGKSHKSKEAYSDSSFVVKRSIAMPHTLFNEVPSREDSHAYEIYTNLEHIPSKLRVSYVMVSVIPGPGMQLSSVGSATIDSDNKASQNNNDIGAKSPDLIHPTLSENKKIIAKLIHYKSCSNNLAGLSPALAMALRIDRSIGELVVLKPAMKPIKTPSTLVIHPYVLKSKNTEQMVFKSISDKERKKMVTDTLMSTFFSMDKATDKTPITNFSFLSSIPLIFPYGGILQFRRNDDPNTWFIHDSKSTNFKIEIGGTLVTEPSSNDNKYKNLCDIIGEKDRLDEIIYGISSSRNEGSFISGNSGSGKTLILNKLARDIENTLGYFVKFVSCETIMNENYTQVTTHIRKWIQECSWHQPSVLVLDNLDKLIPANSEQNDSTQSNQTTEFLISQLSKVQSQRNSNVSLLCSAVSRDTINKLLSQAHVIENFIQLKPPDKLSRSDYLTSYLQNELRCSFEFDIMDLVSETEGYLPNDLKTICDRMHHEALFCSNRTESALVIKKDHMLNSLSGFTPSNLRGIHLQKSVTSWKDIGGLKDAKRILLETLEWPTKYAPIFANCPLRLRSGILLYGYPGCGKTLLASAVAAQCGINFISVKGPEILNKYIGASEQSVRELFERASSAKPCILFFDEFDSIAPKRGHDSTGVTDRVVNQMLTQMDGAEGLDGVYVLAATSRPDLIDSALLRPGRLDKSIICDLPNYEDRLNILTIITDKMQLDSSVKLEEIAKLSEGFSGADMQGLGYNAYLKAVHIKLEHDQDKLVDVSKGANKSGFDFEFFSVDNSKAAQKSNSAKNLETSRKIEALLRPNSQNLHKINSDDFSSELNVIISHDMFLQSLVDTKPSISEAEKIKLGAIYRNFVSERDGNMPDGSTSNEIGGRITLM